MKQALRSWRREHGRRLRTAARLTEDHHVVRIAAEVLDVVAHPFERRGEIHDSRSAGAGELGRRAQIGEMQIAKRGEPMIHGDDDNVAEARKLRAVEAERVARAGSESAAVERHEHWT